MPRGSKRADDAARRKEEAERKKERAALADEADVEFANRVQALMAETFEGDGVIHGEAVDGDDAGRVAAALAFLQVQAREYLRLQMDLLGHQAPAHPRTRVCQYALLMLNDIAVGAHHPVRTLFRGTRLPTNEVESEDAFFQAAIIAGVESILETPEGAGKSRPWALARLQEQPDLAPFVQDTDNLAKLISRKGLGGDGRYKDREIGRQVKPMRAFMREYVPNTALDISTWVSRVVWSRKGPLSLDEASRHERRRALQVGPGGRDLALVPGLPMRRPGSPSTVLGRRLTLTGPAPIPSSNKGPQS